MELFLTHRSALELWRLSGRANDGQIRKQRNIVVPDLPPRAAAIKQVVGWGLTLPLVLTVSNPSAKRATNRMRSHIFTGPLPGGSILRASDGVLVSSPELCFFQMASQLPLVKLIELG